MSDFLDKLREKAVFFKLSPKEKYGGAVSVDDVIKVLKSLTESYNSFIDIEYDRINTQIDKSKIKRIKSGLIEENSLMVVDLKFESYGMAVSPNTVTYKHTIPNIKQALTWKSASFETYKNFILEGDFNSKSYLTKVVKKYSPIERKRIYKPLIDGIILNKKTTTKFGFGTNSPKKTLIKPKGSNYHFLVPGIEKVQEDVNPDITTSMALVEIKEGKVNPKILELFAEIKNPVFTFDKIEFDSTTYNIRYPIYCELIHEEDLYSLENKQLGIYAFGKTVEEAQGNFSEEFDYIFTRYNSLSDDELTKDVVTIKQFLNLIVI